MVLPFQPPVPQPGGGLPPQLAALLGGAPPPPNPLAGGLGPQGFGAPSGMANPMTMGSDPTIAFIQAELARQAGLGQESTTAPDTKPKMKKGKKKPTPEQIEGSVSRVTAMWAARDNRMDEDLQLYRLTQESTTAGEIVQKNTPYVVVEKAANMIASQTPTIQIVAPSEADRDQAQKVENFLRWSWEKWNKRWRKSQFQGSLRHDLAHFLCLRGWAAARIWYDEEADTGREHPIKIKLFDPRGIYPMPGDDGLQYVVHRYWTTYGELNEEWPEAEKKFRTENPEDQVEVTEYYDDWFHYISVAGTVVKPVTQHGYGFVPWVINTGNGAPIRATAVDQTSWVQEVGVSIFHGVKNSYKSLNKIMSQLATQVANAANPATLYYYDPALNETPQPLDYTAGTTNYLLYDRERVDPLNLNTNPTEVGPLMDSLIDDIQKGTLPSVLWGQGGTQSGFNASMMTDAARDQLFSIVEAMQETVEQLNECQLLLIRDFVTEDIGFWTRDPSGNAQSGVTLSAADIEAVGVENTVKYRDISPKDRATMAQLAAMLTDKKLISLETAREEYLMLDNPERENERVLFDLINMDEDVVKKGLVPLTLYQTDPALFQFYMTLKAAELAGNAQQGPPGMPPMPPGMGGGGPPGLPPGVQPAVMQPGANLLQQSLGSALGGPGGGVPAGVPGAGAMPQGLPIGL
jgi:hypothetical protein